MGAVSVMHFIAVGVASAPQRGDRARFVLPVHGRQRLPRARAVGRQLDHRDVPAWRLGPHPRQHALPGDLRQERRGRLRAASVPCLLLRCDDDADRDNPALRHCPRRAGAGACAWLSSGSRYSSSRSSRSCSRISCSASSSVSWYGTAPCCRSSSPNTGPKPGCDVIVPLVCPDCSALYPPSQCDILARCARQAQMHVMPG
jgi:hypothetical protein